MSPEFTVAVVLIAGLALLGLPIGHTMIGGSIVYLLMSGLDMGIAAEKIVQGLYRSYILLAIPLFIFAADLMNAGSLSDRLLKFSLALVGRFRGGLGHVNVVASLIFSGMSGSALADAAGMGRLVINLMTRDGKYSPSYAAAITAASATIGPIIPPSIPLVLYALIANTSIGYLFLAGVLPGILIGVSLMILNAFLARRRNFPVEERVPLREFPRTTGRALPALMLPVILLVGIYGGVTTPTEAAALAAAYAFLVSIVLYRSISPRQAYATALQSAKSTAAIGILIAGALAFNYVVTVENLPNALRDVMATWDLSPAAFLLIVNIILIVLGCLLEGTAILLVIVPMFLPTAAALGIDPVHFGIVAVVNIMIGLSTPPFGLLLFVVANITKAPLGHIIRAVLPFLAMLLVALGLITYIPEIVLWLPRLYGYEPLGFE